MNKRMKRYRWVCFFIICSAFILTNFHRYSMAVLYDCFSADLSLKAAGFGLLTSVYFYIYGLMQVPTGILVDIRGIRPVIVTSLIIAAAGTFFMSAAQSFTGLFISRTMISLGVATIWISALKTVAVWFEAGEFAFLSGLGGLIGNLGMILAGIPFSLLVSTVGWRQSLWLIGIITMFVAAGCFVLIRDKADPPGSQSTALSLKGERVLTKSIKLGLKKVLGNKNSWFPFAAAFFSFAAYGSLLGMWVIPFLTQVYGFGLNFAAGFSSVSALGFTIGLPLAGFFTDKVFKVRRAPLLFLLSLSLIMWITVICKFQTMSQGLLYVVFFIFGLTNSNVLIALTIGKEVNPPEYAGIAIGFVNSGSFLGVAAAQPVMGYLLDLSWRGELLNGVKVFPADGYYLIARISCLLALAALVSAFLARETNCKNVSKPSTSLDA